MHYFSLEYGEWAVIHGDGSSTAGRSQLIHCNMWFSQGQINAIVPVSSIPAGAHFCVVVPLWPSYFYIPKINILAIRMEAAIALLIMSRRPSVSRESKQKLGSGWAHESSQVAVGQSPLPFHVDGKMHLQHPR